MEYQINKNILGNILRISVNVLGLSDIFEMYSVKGLANLNLI